MLKAKLQRPDGVGWSTIATWATIWISLFRRKTLKEIQNVTEREALSLKAYKP
jgi:hypothetical protein